MQLPRLGAAVALVLALTVVPVWAHDSSRPDPLGEQAGVVPVPVSTASTSPQDSFPRLDRIPDPLPVERFGLGAVEGIGILTAGLGLAGLRRAWRRDRRTAIAMTTAALALGFVLETTPHLVHHSLDADQGAGCEALQAAERSQVAAGSIEPASATGSAALADASVVTTSPMLFAPAPRGRAPPA